MVQILKQLLNLMGSSLLFMLKKLNYLDWCATCYYPYL